MSAPTVIAKNLEVPWSIALLPDGGILFTERPGRVRLIDAAGNIQEEPVLTLSTVKAIGEGGLLGIALDPDFVTNRFVYLYYTYASAADNTLNRVVRMTYVDAVLQDEQIILDQIPGASNHNGGRIKFGPDGYLYIATGDASEPSRAQDTQSLAGKILRIQPTGAAAPGNPFGNAVYSYGHRNPQGLAWDAQGTLWVTEHGRSGVLSGFDELNQIEPGQNYGWPTIQGDEVEAGTQRPIVHSGATTTWAPGSLAIVNQSLIFTGLRGQALYRVDSAASSLEVSEHFKGIFGRIRDIVATPDGWLYFTTSNRDGRGRSASDDDKIMKVHIDSLIKK